MTSPVQQMPSQIKSYQPFAGPFDPCPPMKVRVYSTPPHLYLGFQPPGLPQFGPYEALQHGTLWPALYSPWKGVENE